MKAAEEIATRYGLFHSFTKKADSIVLQAMKEYAKEVAKQALKNASIYFGSEWNKGVILNENNIPAI